jgi:GNAT superfamily N-acetyltransferase
VTEPLDTPIVIREVYTADDPLFLPAMELYVESFPRDEREPLSEFVRRSHPCAEHRQGTNTRSHLLVAHRGDEVVAMRQCHYDPPTGLGFFVYIAVAPAHRNRGVGLRVLEYSRALLRLDALGTGTQIRATMFECERVCDSADAEEAAARRARLAYFDRHGGRIVSGTYVQPAIGPDRDPVPLNLMAYPEGDRFDRAALVRDFYSVYFHLGPEDPAVHAALEGVPDECPR